MCRKYKGHIITELRELAFHKKTQPGIQDLAKLLNPRIRGWVHYYGKISRSSLQPLHNPNGQMDTQQV